MNIAALDALHFCGQIDNETVDLTIRSLDAGYFDILVIDSLGGYTKAGIRLGRYLNQHDVDLYVNGICMSACAQFVMLGARRVALRENSIVAMHDTQTATNMLLPDRMPPGGAALDTELERAFYEDVGVPSELLTVPLSELQPFCVGDAVDRDGVTGFKLGSAHSYYMPDARYMAEIYPGKLLTDWPTAGMVDQAVERINANAPDFGLRLNYGYPDKSARLKSLPTCEELKDRINDRAN